MRANKIFIVVGARPNFMKAASVIEELKKISFSANLNPYWSAL